MPKVICLGTGAGKTICLATTLATAHAIHVRAYPPEMPSCYTSLAHKPSWVQQNKGKISKQQRRK